MSEISRRRLARGLRKRIAADPSSGLIVRERAAHMLAPVRGTPDVRTVPAAAMQPLEGSRGVEMSSSGSRALTPLRAHRSRTRSVRSIPGAPFGAPKKERGRSPTTSPSWARPTPTWFGIAVATVDGAVYAVGRRGPALHDPVDLQAVRLRHGARGPRRASACSRTSASSRRATRSTRSWSTSARAGRSTRWSTPARSSRPGSSRARTPTSASTRLVALPRPLRRARARHRRGRLRVGARDRRPQPRDRLPHARASGCSTRRRGGRSTSTSASARCW